jgi:hypothetical protein
LEYRFQVVYFPQNLAFHRVEGNFQHLLLTCVKLCILYMEM